MALAPLLDASSITADGYAVLMGSPAVSVITPYRDACRFVPGLVATLQAQTFRNWECILVDHGSVDSGAALARSLAGGDPRFKHVSMPRGWMAERQLPAIPRNEALRHAQAPLLAFLDVDDLWHPQRLERQFHFHAQQNLDLSVSAYARFEHTTGMAWRWRCPPSGDSLLGQIWHRNPVPMLTSLVRRELLPAGFPVVPHEDYLLWLSLVVGRPALRYGCLPQILGFYRHHAGNLSRRPQEVARWTYGVYRCADAGRLGALALMLRWGCGHLLRSGRERLPDRQVARLVNELLNEPPIDLGCGT